MPRLLALLVVAAACGTTPDDRPPTFEVVSLAVLAPACGTVACHSTTTNIEGYAFDTLAASRAALRRLVVAGSPARSRLVDVITRNEMPPDAPIADEDVALISTWISNGAAGL